jgi:hypothetical protein
MVVSVATVATVVAADVPVVGAYVAVVPATLSFLFSRRSSAQARIVHDPSRDDYESATSLSPSKLDFEVLGTAPTRLPSRLLISADAASRSLSAMLRALERAWGAQIEEELNVAREREREAFRFAAFAREALAASPGGAAELRSWLGEIHDDSSPGSGPVRDGPLEDLLPEASLALLYKLGVPRSYLRTQRPRLLLAEPLQSLGDAVDRAAVADDEYGAFLASPDGAFTDLPPARF